MPKFNLSVPHELTHEEAASRLRSFTDKVHEYYGDQVSDLRQDWDGDRMDFGFKTFGMQIKGTMDVQPSQVDVHGDLPMAAAMFKGKIESSIREQLTKILR